MSAIRDALRDLPETAFADLFESEGAYLLRIDLPGATAETVDVSVADGRIVIEARRRKDVPDGFQYLSEERSLFLDAEIPVPCEANPHDTTAHVDRGVLTLSIPKRTSGDETTIPVEGR